MKILKNYILKTSTLKILVVLAISEYHLYPMSRPFTLKNQASKLSKYFPKYKVFSTKELNSLTEEVTQELNKLNPKFQTKDNSSRSSKSQFFKAIPAIAILGYATSLLNDQNNDYKNQLGNEWNEDTTPLSNSSTKKEFITHTVNDQETLDRITQYGLRSSKSFIQFLISRPFMPEKFKEKFNDTLLKYEMTEKLSGFIDGDQIFFSPKESFIGKHGHIGMFVDPDKTYVFNMSYKDTANPELYSDSNWLNQLKARIDLKQRNKKYKRSRVLLSTYLESLKKAEQMRRDNPNKLVLLDEKTAEPFYTDPSVNLSTMYPYIAEIPFNTSYIPPTFLHRKKYTDIFDTKRFKYFRKSINDLKQRELIS